MYNRYEICFDQYNMDELFLKCRSYWHGKLIKLCKSQQFYIINQYEQILAQELSKNNMKVIVYWVNELIIDQNSGRFLIYPYCPFYIFKELYNQGIDNKFSLETQQKIKCQVLLF